MEGHFLLFERRRKHLKPETSTNGTAISFYICRQDETIDPRDEKDEAHTADQVTNVDSHSRE